MRASCSKTTVSTRFGRFWTQKVFTSRSSMDFRTGRFMGSRSRPLSTRRTGRVLHLDIEPEPDCLLETAGETAVFFERWVFDAGAAMLAGRLGISGEAARDHLRDHVQVCFDVCHCGVEYETPAEALAQL